MVQIYPEYSPPTTIIIIFMSTCISDSLKTSEWNSFELKQATAEMATAPVGH